MMVHVPAPLPRRLGPGEIHVWRVPLEGTPDAVDGRSADAERLLSPDERDRAARFALPHLRSRWVAARTALRTILGSYLDRPPASLAFAIGARGKPSLEGPLHFNLAHSGDLALVAVTSAAPIGVDLEQVRPVREAEAIARRFFSPDECADLAAVSHPDRDYAFLSCWTRKEALLKASGEGLALPLDRFRVSVIPGAPARLLSVAGDETAARAWWLAHLDPAPGFVGAVALAGEWDRELSVLGFRFSVARPVGLRFCRSRQPRTSTDRTDNRCTDDR